MSIESLSKECENLKQKVRDLEHLNKELLRSQNESSETRVNRVLKSTNIQLVRQCRFLMNGVESGSELIQIMENLATDLKKGKIEKRRIEKIVSSIHEQTKSYKINVANGRRQEYFHGGNKFINDEETNLHDIFQERNWQEIPPFIDISNLAAFEDNIGNLYKAVSKLLYTLSNEKDEIRKECEDIIKSLQRTKFELVELNFIVPSKFEKKKNPIIEKESHFTQKKDDFELNWTYKKVSKKFFRSKKQHEELLKSMIDCYKKQKHLWSIEKEILQLEIDKVKRECDLLRGDFKEGKRKTSGKKEVIVIDYKSLDEMKELIYDLLTNFENFEKESNQENLRDLLVYLGENQKQLKELSNKQFEKRIFSVEKSVHPITKREKKITNGEIFRNDDIFLLEKEKLEREMYETEENLLKEPAFMKEKSGDVFLPPPKRSTILKVNNSIPRKERIKKKKRKKIPKKKSNVDYLRNQMEVLQSGISTLEIEYANENLSQLQKYSLKKLISREKAKLKKVERTYNEVTKEE